MFMRKNKGEKYKVQRKSCHIRLHIIDKDNDNDNDENSNHKHDLSELNGTSFTDPLGSYTGIPENPYEKPVQDVDDL